ncbi:putative mRNA-capping enzyme [Brazilian marseillevirus]|uniref:putative mRNA-capping enzyme n=1 Tax=Brazilian marseillevirus TaxID=1813599 RepID=UPI000782D9F7|nr:putative mRNA-capping enzyme [Brazilian marseillevirus]AMQ10882.1 putative mRNA-capping enzyme [Brazilian marseillevirus]
MSQLSEWFGSNEVSQFLTKQDANIEVELSFGRWRKTDRHQKFEPGVTKAEFYNLFESLDQISKKSPELFRREDVHTLEETMKSAPGQRANIRRIKNLSTGEVSFLMKDRSKVWDERNWGLRFAISREEELGVVPNFKAYGFREKQRTRFVFVGEKSAFKGLTVDMTKVVRSSFRDGVAFEVEVEKDSSVPKTAAAMTNSVKRIFEMMQSKSSCQTNEIISMKEKETALEMFDRLMGSKRYGDTSFLNKPRQVDADDLFEPRLFAVTNKLDGERRLLWFGSTGTYLVNPPFDIQKIAGVIAQYKDTVLDVELYGQELGDCSCYAFDCLWFMGQSQYNKNFDTRFSHVLEIEENVGQEARVIAKKYFEVSTSLGSFEGMPTATKDTRKLYLQKARTGKLGGDLLKEAVDRALEYAEKQKFRTDGLILQPREQGYKNEDTLKWKPADQMTIDFRLKRKSDNEFFLMMGGPKDRELKFEGTAAKRIPGTVVLPKEFIESHPGHDFEGEILEFGFDLEKSVFVPHRVRTDKDVPNYVKTVLSVWGNIFRGVSLETLRGDTLVLPRKYNNKLKQCLLGIPKDVKTILDIGSGRGGDIQKWQHSGFSSVKMIEPNEENIREFERRAKITKFTGYKLFHGKAQETQRIVKFFGTEKVDFSSAFYCLGYFAETKKNLEDLCNTMSSMSSDKAMAAFAFMDGQAIREILGRKKKFENPAFSLEKEGEWTSKKYGNAVKVHIKDEGSMVKHQTEWLVDLEMLQDVMKGCGYELVFSRLADEGVSFLSTVGFEFVSLHRVAVFRKI